MSEPSDKPRSRVVIVRDEKCLKPPRAVDPAAARKMLDAALARLTGRAAPAQAWGGLCKPGDRVGVKVNTLGLPTHPTVAAAIAACLVAAGVKARNVLVWDRSTAELKAAGYEIVTRGDAVRCHGTDAVREPNTVAGYEARVVTSGAVGSRYSTIVSRWATALINAPVLKDHSLSGLSGGLKNFFGAIHNPNKYHDDYCDPFIADVSMHPWISRKLRLVVVDATYAQYHGGPGTLPRARWPLAALILGTDPVAVDAVCLDLLDKQRKAKGLKPVAEDGRPAKHIRSAQLRHLGTADLKRIEIVEI